MADTVLRYRGTENEKIESLGPEKDEVLRADASSQGTKKDIREVEPIALGTSKSEPSGLQALPSELDEAVSIKYSMKDRPPFDTERRTYVFEDLPSHGKDQNSFKPKFEYKKYDNRKNVAKGLVDATLLQFMFANVKSLLKNHGTDKEHPLFSYLLPTVIFAIFLQVFIGLLFLYIGTFDIDNEEEQEKAMTLNDFATGLMVVMTVLNTGISAFMEF